MLFPRVARHCIGFLGGVGNASLIDSALSGEVVKAVYGVIGINASKRLSIRRRYSPAIADQEMDHGAGCWCRREKGRKIKIYID